MSRLNLMPWEMISNHRIRAKPLALLFVCNQTTVEIPLAEDEVAAVQDLMDRKAPQPK